MITHRIFNKGVIAILLYLPIFISACGDWAVRDYPHPDSVILQQPAAGQALIYFLRAPHDSVSISLLSNGKRVAKMSPETYVALSLPPGRYRFVTTSAGLLDDKEVADPLEITLKPNERTFYHVSGIDEKRMSLIGIINTQGAGPVPLLGRESVVKNRVWKECTELDARGLITISRQVQPEK